jgi:mannose-6-phosphate isomerase-like protein (cupin superfamily)
MYNFTNQNYYPYEVNPLLYSNYNYMYNNDLHYPYNYQPNVSFQNQSNNRNLNISKDYGPEPYVVNIEDATKRNSFFRTALWTGDYLQLTLMSINPGDDIGLEVHPDHDQFIRIEEGQGTTLMGDDKDNLTYQRDVYDNFAVFVPAGKWHNIINTGFRPLKLYSIYAPAEHPYGTVHKTKEDDIGH